MNELFYDVNSRLIASLAVALLAGSTFADEPARQNHFNDPFLQVTDALPACPRQEGPLITYEEMQAQAHYRAERGTSCYRSGRCRLPNAFMYDREIIPRVKQAILSDGRFAGTSVWVEGQRRWVFLKGCVANAGQSQAIETLVRNIDDVESVINQLTVVSP